MQMTVRGIMLILALVVALPGTTLGQDPGSDLQGMALFRGRCANCHGVDARGFRAPDLLDVPWSDRGDDLFQVIRSGIPGTEMPRSGMKDTEIRAVMAYLTTLNRPEPAVPVSGNRANGQRIYWESGGCGECHRIDDRGGRLGPELTRIGSARSRRALVREIRNASEFIVRGYRAVTLITDDGERVRGAVKNEDTFSIQIMDSSQRLRAFLKSDLRELTHEDRSLMPDYPVSRLSAAELDDLLSYLGGLR